MVDLMNWPACSPDLNPIENVWEILTRRFYKENERYENFNELKTSFIREWGQIDSKLLIGLSNSMKMRIFDVDRCQGSLIDR